MRAKQIGVKIDRNPAKHMSKTRHPMAKIDRLLLQGRLEPIYKSIGDDLCIIGYQRKPTSRKRSQGPFLLKQPIVLGVITKNPETESCNTESKK